MVLEHLCLNPLINPNPYNKSKKIKGGNLSLKTISRSVIHLHFAVTCLESNEVNGQKEQELQEQTAGRSAWGFSSGVWAGVHQTRLLSTGLYHQKTPCSHCNLYGMEWTETSYFSFSSHISFPAAASFPYSVPLTTLDLLTSAISSNSTSSSLSVPGCVPLRSRFCSGSITHTRKGTSALCYSFLPQASSLISSYSQSSFFQVKYFFYI